MLKRKVDNGATRAITQFFFDNDLYESYVERARRAGIYIPIVPGVLPIHNFTQVANFSARCGAHVPAWLAERFDGLQDDPQTHALVAAAVAAEQVMDLVERGVSDFHFYTMNRADLVVRHLPHDRHQGRITPMTEDLGRRLRRRLSRVQEPKPDKRKGRAFARPFQNLFAFSGCYHRPFASAYGRTPIMRAPIKANAAQIMSALIGRVSPIRSLLI